MCKSVRLKLGHTIRELCTVCNWYFITLGGKRMNFNVVALVLVIEASSKTFFLFSSSSIFFFKKFRQIDVHTLVSLDAKWLENRREFGGIGRVHPLAESEICNWFFSFFVGPCPFLAWLLRKIRELDHHLHRNTLSLFWNKLEGQTPEIFLKSVHHTVLKLALYLRQKHPQ